MKFRIILSALMASAMTLDAYQLAAADPQLDVKNGEEVLENRRIRDGDKSPFYVMELVMMANKYRRNGELQKGIDAIKKAISIEEKFPDRANMIPEILFLWAGQLVDPPQIPAADPRAKNDKQILYLNQQIHKAEIEEAEKVTKQAVAYLDARPHAISPRILGHLSLYGFYKQQKMEREKDEEFKVVEQLLQQAEKSTVSREDLVSTAGLLVQAANEFSPNTLRTSRYNQRHLPLSDGDFTRAEAFRLRAITLFNTLPANDIARIDGNRDLAIWYKLVSREDKEKEQTSKLEKLMGTTDRKLLFPEHAGCGACGMG